MFSSKGLTKNVLINISPSHLSLQPPFSSSSLIFRSLRTTLSLGAGHVTVVFTNSSYRLCNSVKVKNSVDLIG